MGSKLVTQELVQQMNFEQLTRNVRETLDRVARIRSSLKK
jgi:2-keto-3-deoxy-6-phosphogluconate aldolase